MRDAAVCIPKAQITTCLGMSKKTKKRCKNKASENGYCHIHSHQAPKKQEKHVAKHTHTLPPFFMKGCPVCEKSNHFRDLADSFDNE